MLLLTLIASSVCGVMYFKQTFANLQSTGIQMTRLSHTNPWLSHPLSQMSQPRVALEIHIQSLLLGALGAPLLRPNLQRGAAVMVLSTQRRKVNGRRLRTDVDGITPQVEPPQ